LYKQAYKNFSIGQSSVPVVSTGYISFCYKPIELMRLDVLVTNFHKFGINSTARRFRRIKCKSNASNLGESAF